MDNDGFGIGLATGINCDKLKAVPGYSWLAAVRHESANTDFKAGPLFFFLLALLAGAIFGGVRGGERKLNLRE